MCVYMCVHACSASLSRSTSPVVRATHIVNQLMQHSAKHRVVWQEGRLAVSTPKTDPDLRRLPCVCVCVCVCVCAKASVA